MDPPKTSARTPSLASWSESWSNSSRVRSAYRGRADALGVLDGYGEEMIAGYRSVTACNRQALVTVALTALMTKW